MLFSGEIGSCEVGWYSSGAPGILRILNRFLSRSGSQSGTNISDRRIRFWPCAGVAKTLVSSSVSVVTLRLTIRYAIESPRQVGKHSQSIRSYCRSARAMDKNPVLILRSCQAPPFSDAWMWYRIVVVDFFIIREEAEQVMRGNRRSALFLIRSLTYALGLKAKSQDEGL